MSSLIEPTPHARFSRSHLLLVAVVALLLLGVWISAESPTPLFSSPATLGACSGDNLVDETMPTGARWELCWSHDDQQGIVISEAHYTTPEGTRRRVLETASLAQIHVPYDDDSQRLHQVTDYGMGANALLELSGDECANGSIRWHNDRPVVCVNVQPRGYVYKDYGHQKQGHLVNIHSVSHMGESTYVVRWQFHDDGVIEPSIGATGQLERINGDATTGWPIDNTGNYGVGHINNYYWRIDFGLGADSSDEYIEEFIVNPVSSRSEKRLFTLQLVEESARTLNPDTKLSWRIADSTITNDDGQPISYHLEPLHAAHTYIGTTAEPFTEHSIWFTTDKACEQFASHNPTCGADVSEFVDGEGIDSADIVIWYRLTRHILPRDEDQPYRPIVWDAFQLVPRDWTGESHMID